MIFHKLLEQNPILNKYEAVFDGKEFLYCREELEFFNNKVYSIQLTDKFRRQQEFTLTFLSLNSLSLKSTDLIFHGRSSAIRKEIPQQAVMAVDEVLRAQPNLLYTAIGGAFFERNTAKNILLGGGRELWFGFFQSISPIERHLSVTIDGKWRI